jgi:hypothetical protein
MTLNDYKAYGDHLVATVDRLRSVQFVSELVEIEDMVRNLKPTEMPVLVMVEPVTQFKGPDEDNIRHEFPCLVFVLTRIDKKNLKVGELLQHKDAMRNLGLDVANRMRADKSSHGAGHLMCLLDLGSMNLEPEEDVAGLSGYSLSFTLREQWK